MCDETVLRGPHSSRHPGSNDEMCDDRIEEGVRRVNYLDLPQMETEPARGSCWDRWRLPRAR